MKQYNSPEIELIKINLDEEISLDQDTELESSKRELDD